MKKRFKKIRSFMLLKNLKEPIDSDLFKYYNLYYIYQVLKLLDN